MGSLGSSVPPWGSSKVLISLVASIGSSFLACSDCVPVFSVARDSSVIDLATSATPT